MTDTPWLDPTEQRAWRSFLAAQRQLTSSLAGHLQRESGLSDSDYEILVNLSEAPDKHLRAFELAEATQWEKSRLSHHLTRMERRGLIERRTCADDTRYCDIVLTDTGRAAIRKAAPSHVAHVRTWFIDAMTPDQLHALAAACDAITTALHDRPTTPCHPTPATPESHTPPRTPRSRT